MAAFSSEPHLVPARKLPDGTVELAKPGETHDALVGPHDVNMPGLGFVHRQTGGFLDRHEALAYVKQHEPERAVQADTTVGLTSQAYNGEAQNLAMQKILQALNMGGYQ